MIRRPSVSTLTATRFPDTTLFRLQLSQYADAARKAVEIKQGWQASVWKKLLAAYEEARPLAIEAQKRQLGELASKIVTGEVTRDDGAAALTWNSDLSACAADELPDARANKRAIENELPASIVQLTEQVEYGRQFQQPLGQACG